jgi:hypothetical protein
MGACCVGSWASGIMIAFAWELRSWLIDQRSVVRNVGSGGGRRGETGSDGNDPDGRSSPGKGEEGALEELAFHRQPLYGLANRASASQPSRVWP